jgi:hypothetical protein
MNYNPQPDRSGEILALAGTRANDYRMAGMGALTGGISEALKTVATAYTDSAKTKAEGRAFKQVFGVVAPAMGISEEQLKEISKGMKDDNDWAAFGRAQTGSIGSLIQHNMYGPNAQRDRGNPRPIDTASGMVVWNPNTGQVTPMVGADGRPLIGRTGLSASGEGEFDPLYPNNSGGLMNPPQGQSSGAYPHGTIVNNGGTKYISVNGNLVEMDAQTRPAANTPPVVQQTPATAIPVPTAPPPATPAPPASPDITQSELDAMTVQEREAVMARRIRSGAAWIGRSALRGLSALGDGAAAIR